MTPAEQTRVCYLATIEHGTSLPDILKSDYWANVANKLRPLFLIDCWWEDGSRYTQLLVTKASRNEATVIVLNDRKITGAATKSDLSSELADYIVEYAGPSIGHRVVRKSDKVTLHSDERWNEEDAKAWLLTYIAQLPRDAKKPAAKQAA